MKKTLFFIVTVCSFALPAAAMDIKAITAKLTAGNPQFKNKKAWPTLVGDEYFLKEKWEKGRILIWDVKKSLEKGAGKRRSKVDGSDPANWINAATGKAAAALPDMKTDIILPDSDVPYTASLRQRSVRQMFCRHVTIGRNAALAPIYGRGGFQIAGNLWIHPEGSIKTGMWALLFIGEKHTFVRYDWPKDGKLKKIHDERLITPYEKHGDPHKQPWWTNLIATYMRHTKSENASTEVIGFVALADEIAIQSGVFVVGRNSRFVTVGPSAVSVDKAAQLILMDGAHCSHGMNQFMTDWGVRAGGKVSGGAPDRPLKKDAFFGMGYNNWMNLPIPPDPKRKSRKIKPLKSGTKIHYGYGKYNTKIEGDLIGYPAPGSNAKLVVCWQRMRSGGAGSWGRRDEVFQKAFPKIEPKIGLLISGKSKIENVCFDDLHRGGIVTPSMETFKQWKNISFGDGCLSKDPKELIRGFEAEVDKWYETLEPKKKYTTR